MNNRPSILVTGGAGYIAAPTIALLTQKNYHVVVIDTKDVSEFQMPQLLEQQHVSYVQADYADVAALAAICEEHAVVACIHFAAFAEVGESVEKPAKYYDNNVSKTIRLLDTLRAYQVHKIIFSSSCSVYGMPQWMPLTEEHSRNPLSPYGRSKMIVEMILEDYSRAYNVQYVSLRYFNAAGALPELGLGERHEPESHLIPRALQAAYTGEPFGVFGNDYATEDGTCVRDYLHIADLATAHVAALEYLMHNKPSMICNLGTGNGYSVEEIIKTVAQTTNLTREDFAKQGLAVSDSEKLRSDLINFLLIRYELYTQGPHVQVVREAQKWIMLESIDQAWKQHMLNLDSLKEGIGLRQVGQKNPLIEYKRESFAMFEDMMRNVRWEIVHHIFHLDLERFDQRKIEQRRENELRDLTLAGGQETTVAGVTVASNTSAQSASAAGRNEPCPCGSDKKYKKCCGK